MRIVQYSIFFLSMFGIQCKHRIYTLSDEKQQTPSEQIPHKPHLTTTVPPLEMQKGGDDFFAHLTPVSQTHPNVASADRIYINQPLDLEKLGPGTNVIFVTDGANWAFAISNGRFESENDLGKLNDGSYPAKDVWRQLDSGEHLDGKYPWPVDAKGYWLPGSKLVTTNGPHGDLEKALKGVSTSTGEVMGGHIGVNIGGKAYLGYVSGSASGNSGTTDEARSLDSRALPIKLRKTFHDGVRRAARGRSIDQVLKTAPETVEDFNRGASTEDSLRKRARNHPIGGSNIATVDTSQSPLELLIKALDEKTLLEYIQKINDPTTLLRLTQNPVFLEKLFSFKAGEFGQTIRFLVRAGTNVQLLLDRSGISEELSKILIANVELETLNKANAEGYTLLMRAVIKNDERMVKLLVERGVDQDILTPNEESAKMLAQKWGRSQIVEYFEKVAVKKVESPAIKVQQGLEIEPCDIIQGGI
jgi:hypothetical protein